MNKEYRVKVIEKHVDYVWVTASSAEDAESQAHEFSECQFDSLYSCEVVENE